MKVSARRVNDTAPVGARLAGEGDFIDAVCREAVFAGKPAPTPGTCMQSCVVRRLAKPLLNGLRKRIERKPRFGFVDYPLQ